ncbi:ABC transporter permease subunit [Xylophilus rhododendri]|uniref:ABC transporter permease subunit n=1 Tax=Xylophilus rhododendri TaxID=2697032 RepID=A0A857J8D2_9BURK|nr:ABC transporter permease subunit [Xylophilus rhododendri]QHI99473.1 ABC transporter permease subunit [Xylophilus rhododendri]
MNSTAIPLPPGAALHAAPRRRWNRAAVLAAAPLLVFLLLFFVGPIAGLMKEGFLVDGQLSLSHYRHLLDTPIYRIVLGNTFTIAVAVTISCVVMSYPLAYLMASVSPRIARILFFAVLLPFWSSALVRTSAWIALLGKNGPLNALLTGTGIASEPVAFLFNFTGVMIGTTHVLMPFVLLPLYASFKAMDRTLVQAAQSLGAGSVSIFSKVVLPLTSPGVVAGGIIVFMNAVGYYITPSLMGGPGQRMVAEVISHNITEELNWGVAAALAGVLLVTVLVSLWVFNRLFGLDKLISGSGGKGSSEAPARRTPGGRFSVVAGILSVLFLLAPIVVVIPMSFGTSQYPSFPPPEYGLRWYRSFLEEDKWLAALFSSLKVGLIVTLLASVLGIAAALGVHKMKSGAGKVLDALFVIPMSVPSIITGVSLYYMTAPLGWVANSVAVILGHTVLAAPYVYITVRAALRSFDHSLELAAMGLGASWTVMFRLVMLPALLPGLIGAAVFAFVTSFDDVVMALFLTNVRNRTLPKLMFEGLSSDFDPTVISASCLLVAATALILIAQQLLGRKKNGA